MSNRNADRIKIAEIAQKQCFQALQERNILIPETIKQDLVLGTEITKTEVIYTIYQPQERPENAVMFVTVVVNRSTFACHVAIEPAAIKYESK